VSVINLAVANLEAAVGGGFINAAGYWLLLISWYRT